MKSRPEEPAGKFAKPIWKEKELGLSYLKATSPQTHPYGDKMKKKKRHRLPQ
jgi:hypothetical protein